MSEEPRRPPDGPVADAVRPEPGPGPAGAPEPREPLLQRIIEYGLLLLLVLSPLPLGSVEDWSILVIELAVLLLAGAYTLLEPKPALNPRLRAGLRRLRWIWLALFGFLGLQVLPLPSVLVRVLSPTAFALRRQYAPGLAGSKTMTLSLVPWQTVREALELLTYVLAGLLIAAIFTRRRKIMRLMAVLTAAGVVQALYGLFELTRSNPRLLFYKKVWSLNQATGTFVNRNHFSGYLELILPLAIGLLLTRIDMFALAGRERGERLAALTGRGFAANILLLGGILVMVLGVARSQSRSGLFVVLLIFMMFAALIAYHFGRKKYPRGWVPRALKIVLALVVLFALYGGVEMTLNRFSQDKLLQDGRPQYWGSVVTIIGRFPAFGTGLGTFASIYPTFETVPLEGRLLHAHNDYLEYLSELGLIGFLLLMAAVFVLLGDGFRTWANRRHPTIKAMGMGAFVSAAAILVHSLTDFNLHIPANALLFAAVLGLAYAAAYYRKA